EAGNPASADGRIAGTRGAPTGGLSGCPEISGAEKVKRYKAVVFDWDGTVMDSTASIVGAMQAACVDLALPVPSIKDASWVIGLSLQQALLRCAPTLKEEQLAQFIERYRHHFFSFDQHLTLFDGIVPLLEDLKQQDIR